MWNKRISPAFLFGVVLLSALLLIAPQSQAVSAEYWLGKGQAFYELKQYEKAIKAFSSAIDLDPNLAKAYAKRGDAYTYLGDYPLAIKDFNKAINLDPNESVYLIPLVHAYQQYTLTALNGEPALEDYNRLIELNPKDPIAYSVRGDAYTKLGQYNLAIEDYNKAIELNPNNSYAHIVGLEHDVDHDIHGRDKAYVKLGDKWPIEYYSKAIELNPKDAKAYFCRGRVYDEFYNLPKAVEDFSKAISLNPKYVEAFLSRAMVYFIMSLDDKKYSQLENEDYKSAARLGDKFSQGYLKGLGIQW